jgi:predicted secreted protein
MTTIELVVFLMICWWMVFYLTLPFGVRDDNEQIIGQATSAPKNAYIKQKIIITTIITVIITLIFNWYMS